MTDMYRDSPFKPGGPTRVRPSEMLLLPETPEVEIIQGKNRPDGPWLRAIRLVFYVVGIITCLAVLLMIVDLYILIDNVRDAVDAWKDAVTSPGLLGD